MRGSLEVVGLTYRYPKAEDDALRGVDADFPAGTFTVVMGPTGAGKSTLLMALNGVIPQLKEGTVHGDVLLDDANLADYRVSTITEHVGLVLQDPDAQVLGRTVADDVAFGPRNYLVPRAEIRRRVTDALAEVGLTGFEDRKTALLSGGQRQRLAIAGILAIGPQVLCLDEPASELDPQGRAEIYAALDRIRRDGRTTVIVAEHEATDVVGRADQLIVLHEGRVAWQGRPEEFFRDPRLTREHLVKPLPVAVVGAALADAGLIGPHEVPLTVDDAAAIVEKLRGDHPIPAPTAPASGTPPPGAAAAEPAIKLRDVVHAYPDGHRALSGVSLSIGRGEYVALIGRNGAGKTTLAKHLNRLLDPTSGVVLIDGADAARLQPWELARRVGYVFQNPDHQIFNRTVASEIGYGLRATGLTAAEIDHRVDEVLGLTGLAGVRDDHPLSLGKGERQRVAVASILALRPPVLVVDEPTTGQDWAGVRTMMGLIDRLNARGTTILMITHDMDVVAHHARRVIVMDDGRVRADGPTAEVLARPGMLAEAGITTTQTAELCLRLWPGTPPLLDEADLGRHLVTALTGGDETAGDVPDGNETGRSSAGRGEMRGDKAEQRAPGSNPA
ncbi:energy-coupling factor transporter ATPase [Brooklawnia cerclae]|uniref:Energy-coupling factor transport system ATP-binding protein n=1 Tax=Brooklawnia cerclae TaxID=349934 RepID=A0ABX0SI79_9ACTN|nr:ABC transporter ATP-binding protein [Brooklawnia cerclae]NIH57676.1 energy-coupling factor transport system ATP-binding protein [Brooklawnia cerclae]